MPSLRDLSTDDLIALKQNNLRGMSTEGLQMLKQMNYSSQSAVPKQEVSGPDIGAAGQFFVGVNEKLANITDIADLPDLLVEPAARATANVFRGMAGKEPITQPQIDRNPVSEFLRRDAGVQPIGMAQRVARGAGQTVGESIPIVGGMYGAAPVASRATGFVGDIFKSLLNPTKATLAMEGISAAGAGAGEQLAREAGGGDTAQFLSGVAGGMAPSALGYTPVALAARGVKTIRGRLSPESLSHNAAEAVSRVFGADLTDTARANIDEATQLQKQIPGFKPSFAEASDSPAFVRTQQDIERSASGAELESYDARRRANEQAIRDYAGESAPSGQANPEYIIDTASGRITDLQGRLSGAKAKTAAGGEALAERLPAINKANVGVGIRDALVASKASTSEDMSLIARELGIDDAAVPMPWNDWKKEILTEFKPQSAFEDVSNYPEVLRDIKKLNKDTITFKDYKALRERLTDDIIDAQASPKGRAKKLRMLTMLQKRVDDLGDTLMQSSDPDLNARYKEFREIYKREYVDRFEKGSALKVRQKDGRGFYRIPDEQVAASFYAPGDISGIRQFKKIFGKSQDSALEAVVLDDLRNAAVRDGQIDQKLFNSWYRRNETVLNEIPGIKNTVRSYEQSIAAIGKRQASLASREKALQDSLLARELNSFERGTKTAEQIIDTAISNPKKMETLMRSVRRNPDAEASLKRQIWGRANMDDSTQMMGFLTDNEQSLKHALGGAHYKNLLTIQKAREISSRTTPQAGKPISPNVLANLERSIGMGVNQLQSRIFAAHSGRTSWRYVGVDALSRFLKGRSENEVAELFRGALYDPQVAKDMADMIRIKQTSPIRAKRLNAWLFSVGAGENNDSNQ